MCSHVKARDKNGDLVSWRIVSVKTVLEPSEQLLIDLRCEHHYEGDSCSCVLLKLGRHQPYDNPYASDKQC
jgi:hypothetical protein